jgi:signal transduction histidine kinase
VSDKSFIETSNFLRLYAIRHEQQNKESSARQMHNTYQSPGIGNTKKDKVKTVLSVIHEPQVQHSSGSDDDLSIVTISKTSNSMYIRTSFPRNLDGASC